MKLLKSSAIICLGILISAFVYQNKRTQQQAPEDGFVIDTLMKNLFVPWQIVFLPDRTMLFTEREGRVRVYRNGKLVDKPAFVVPDIPLRNKTGLLGMCIHPEFATNKFVYLANNYTRDKRMRLRVVRYQFKNDTLINPFVILENIPANQNHTGCRLLFSPDKKLYITTGDADEPGLAQDLKTYNGKILRFNDDGTIPLDNPFHGVDTALHSIWTYGHRNTQGLAFQPGTGFLFSSEHGPTGGDEINRIIKTGNYGWPMVHHRDSRAGMISPIAEYTPSIAPGEALFYSGNRFPQLQGHLLVACLRGESVLDIQLDMGKVVSQDVLLKGRYGRIRSLVTGPDGYIYFSTSQNDPPEGVARPEYDMILRMRPSGSSNSKLSSQKLVVRTPIKKPAATPKIVVLYQQMCGSCHGNNLQGTERAKGLLGAKLVYGSTKPAIVRTITNGVMLKGMPAWNGAISKPDIDKIADYIISKRKRR
ncbi:PQQ-dependent sugar dehydrogenase [Arcticibacter eurypsychrophilus]|uniref:PQQ-dependent sugar dehydrogenase n=1 Tax=Arcticibacter eurypsychrophilus TaxID=1434752 RepID=UPI00084CF875|nr:PQQ-dependent sugar dehydrogenase [Arcticibacter eurypsychrophilus]